MGPFLLILVLEALSHEFKTGLPWELLYAADLVLIVESLEEDEEKFVKWKEGMETKDLRVNVKKTKVIISGVGEGKVVKSGRWPRAACKKSVGSS